MDVLSLILILGSFSFYGVIAEQSGRIDSNDPHGFVCAKPIYSPKKCANMQLKARERGCVTPEEFELLKRHQLCPSCDWDMPGLNAYNGYCPFQELRFKELRRPRRICGIRFFGDRMRFNLR